MTFHFKDGGTAERDYTFKKEGKPWTEERWQKYMATRKSHPMSEEQRTDEENKEGAWKSVAQRKVTTIPTSISRFTASPIDKPKKRRVAGYARVSTDHDEQFTSYEAQIDYYTNYINSRDDWEFVSVYMDEGISGTGIKARRLPDHDRRRACREN